MGLEVNTARVDLPPDASAGLRLGTEAVGYTDMFRAKAMLHKNPAAEWSQSHAKRCPRQAMLRVKGKTVSGPILCRTAQGWPQHVAALLIMRSQERSDKS